MAEMHQVFYFFDFYTIDCNDMSTKVKKNLSQELQDRREQELRRVVNYTRSKFTSSLKSLDWLEWLDMAIGPSSNAPSVRLMYRRAKLSVTGRIQRIIRRIYVLTMLLILNCGPLLLLMRILLWAYEDEARQFRSEYNIDTSGNEQFSVGIINIVVDGSVIVSFVSLLLFMARIKTILPKVETAIEYVTKREIEDWIHSSVFKTRIHWFYFWMILMLGFGIWDIVGTQTETDTQVLLASINLPIPIISGIYVCWRLTKFIAYFVDGQTITDEEIEAYWNNRSFERIDGKIMKLDDIENFEDFASDTESDDSDDDIDDETGV